MTTRTRLDVELLNRKLVESRTQARVLIEEGRVFVDGEVADKVGRLVDESNQIVVSAPPRFVSRGGTKLLAAIEHFQVSFADCSVLDVGASTGGFTDCALQLGAKHVTCVDVGRGQLHPRLRSDARVVNFEGLNARELESAPLPLQSYDRIVMDLSFISITLALPQAWSRLHDSGVLIALVKPQFEAGRQAVSKGKGIIRDDAVRHESLRQVAAFAEGQLANCQVPKTMECPLHGSDGNREFLMLLRKETASD